MQNLKSAAILFSMLLLAACSAGGSRTALSDNSTSVDETNPLTNVDPTINLFDTPAGSTTNTTSTATNIDQAPTTTTTTLPPADATASSCMASNGYLGDGSATWACLNKQSSTSGQLGQDAVMGMAAASLQMMLQCSTSVRQELITLINQTNVNDPSKVALIFETAKTKMTQCYYRIVNLQKVSVQWSPYQAGVYDYNAGNLWNLMNSF